MTATEKFDSITHELPYAKASGNIGYELFLTAQQSLAVNEMISEVSARIQERTKRQNAQ